MNSPTNSPNPTPADFASQLAAQASQIAALEETVKLLEYQVSVLNRVILGLRQRGSPQSAGEVVKVIDGVSLDDLQKAAGGI